MSYPHQIARCYQAENAVYVDLCDGVNVPLILKNLKMNHHSNVQPKLFKVKNNKHFILAAGRFIKQQRNYSSTVRRNKIRMLNTTVDEVYDLLRSIYDQHRYGSADLASNSQPDFDDDSSDPSESNDSSDSEGDEPVSRPRKQRRVETDEFESESEEETNDGEKYEQPEDESSADENESESETENDFPIKYLAKRVVRGRYQVLVQSPISQHTSGVIEYYKSIGYKVDGIRSIGDDLFEVEWKVSWIDVKYLENVNLDSLEG
jgi:hypothetical protein